MNKTFLWNADLHSARFMASPPAVRGHWVLLQAYCSLRASGGVISGARTFNSREWSAVMGAGGSVGAINRLVAAGFGKWVGDNLVVSWYHQESQDQYQARNVRASHGGLAKAARERERRAQAEARDSRGVPSSNGTALATSRQREGSDSWGEAREGEGRGAEKSSGEDSAPSDVPGPGPSTSPENADDAVALFVSFHRGRFGIAYQPTPADTMAMRENWADLEPDELAERIGSYLRSGNGELRSIVGFLGWYRGTESAVRT